MADEPASDEEDADDTVAFDGEQVTSLPCIAHTINLALKYVHTEGGGPLGEDPPRIWEAANNLYGCFAHSTSMREALAHVQRTNGFRPLRPRNDVPTRFCTKLLQVQRLKDLLPALTILAKTDGEDGMYKKARESLRTSARRPMNFEQCHDEFSAAMLEIPKSLEFMEALTRWMTILSARNTPTLHLVRGFFRYVKQFLAKHLEIPGAAAVVERNQPRRPDHALLLALDNAMDRYFLGGEEIPQPDGSVKFEVNRDKDWNQFYLYRLASFLSATHVEVVENEVGWCTEEDIINQCVESAMHLLPRPSVYPAPEGVVPQKQLRGRRAQPAQPARPIFKGGLPVRSTVATSDPWELVLQVHFTALYSDIINARMAGLCEKDDWRTYWTPSKRGDFPYAWRLFRTIMATPASSVPVESLFSVMKCVDAARRGSLLTERLCNLTLSNAVRFYRSRLANIPIPPTPISDLPLDTSVDGISLQRYPPDDEIEKAAYEAAVQADDPTADIVNDDEAGATADVTLLSDDEPGAAAAEPPAKRRRVAATDEGSSESD
jgi:hypothetical protein